MSIESDEINICTPCIADLPWITRACTRCALPLPTSLAAEFLCADCQNDPPAFDHAVAPLRYEFPVDAAIKALKFQKRLHYGPALAEILLSVCGRLPKDVDALLPVPLHRWRFLRRGFNQAMEIATPLEKGLGLPIIDNVKRRTATPYQSGLHADERRKNLRGAFYAVGNIPYKHVLIVDDVITTGATCRQIARTLKGIGVEEVSVIAVARTAVSQRPAR